MTTKHTPGPWIFDPSNTGSDFDTGYGIYTEPYTMSIERVVGKGTPEANARLISAAPEMLEALKNIREELILSGNWNAKDYGWPENRAAISAAILKAEGD